MKKLIISSLTKKVIAEAINSKIEELLEEGKIKFGLGESVFLNKPDDFLRNIFLNVL